jgi:4-nitrophenyl phosphatase
MYQMAFDRLHLAPEQTLAVGDRLETDIAGGLTAGCQTCLVLSGISTAAEAAITPFKPHLVADSLSALLGL